MGSSQLSDRKRRAPLLYTLAYMVLASLWIWLTQWLLSEVGGYSWRISTTGLIFGEIFVLVTGGGLFLLLRFFMLPKQAVQLQQVRSEHGGSGRGWIISLMLVVAVMLAGQVLLSLYAARAYAPNLIDKARADAEALASIRADRIDHWLMMHRRDIEALAERHDLLAALPEAVSAGKEAQLTTLTRLVAPARFDALSLYDPEHSRKLHVGLPGDLGRHAPDGLFEQAAATAGIRFGSRFDPKDNAVDCYWVLPIFLDHTEVSGGPWYVVFRARLNGATLVRQSRLSAASLFHNSQQFLIQTVSTDKQGPLSLDLVAGGGGAPANQPKIRALAIDRFPKAVRALVAPNANKGNAASEARESQPSQASGLISGFGRLDGQRVIFAALPLPEMHALLLTTLDRDTVMAPVTRLEKWLSVGALIGTIAILSALLVLWRLVRRMHEMQLSSEMSERDRLLLQFYNLPMIGMAVIDPHNFCVERVNQRLAQIYRTNTESLIGMPFDELVVDEDATPIQHSLDRQSVQGLVAGQFDELSLERTVTVAERAQICIHLNVRAVRLPSGYVTALVATVDDVTEERMRSQLLSCQRDLYHMSARTAAALIAVDNPQAMYDDVCRIAVTGTAFTSVCLFLLKDQDIQLAACDGDGLDCLSAFQGSGAIDMLGREWLDRALTSRQPIFLNDLAASGLPASSVSWGRRHRLHGLAILPLTQEGRVMGALVLGSRTTGLWTDEVRAVLVELSDQLARAHAALMIGTGSKD